MLSRIHAKCRKFNVCQTVYRSFNYYKEALGVLDFYGL